MPAPLSKLNLIFASKAPVAAILRQGPRKYIRLISWDRRDESFVEGQWIKGKIYPESCRLSPDGRFLCYAATDYRSEAKFKEYWAISKMPYFSAIALYPQDSYSPSGEIYFVNQTQYVVSYKSKNILAANADISRVEGGKPMALPPAPSSASSTERQDAPLVRANALLDLNQRYPTEGCRLYRRNNDGTSNLIRDFSDMEYEPIMAPYSHDTGEETGWHPLDADP